MAMFLLLCRIDGVLIHHMYVLLHHMYISLFRRTDGRFSHTSARPPTPSRINFVHAPQFRGRSGTNSGTGTAYHPTALPTVGPCALSVPGFVPGCRAKLSSAPSLSKQPHQLHSPVLFGLPF